MNETPAGSSNANDKSSNEEIETSKNESNEDSKKEETISAKSVFHLLKKIETQNEEHSKKVEDINTRLNSNEITVSQLLKLSSKLAEKVTELSKKTVTSETKINSIAEENARKMNDILEKVNAIPTLEDINERIANIPSRDELNEIMDTKIRNALQTRNTNTQPSNESSNSDVVFIDTNVFEQPINSETPNEDRSALENEAFDLDRSQAPGRYKKFRNKRSERIEKFGKARGQFGLTLTKEIVKTHFNEDISDWPNNKIFTLLKDEDT